MNDRESLILGALLHDIGKFKQRTEEYYSGFPPHEKVGSNWLSQNGLNQAIVGIAEFHHEKSPQARAVAIVSQADKLSAGERPEKETNYDEKGKWLPNVPLRSIFSKISLDDRECKDKYLPIHIISSNIVYPDDKEKVSISVGQYRNQWAEFEKDFNSIKDSLSVNNLLVLLEKYTSSIPSEKRIVEYKEGGEKIESHPDISLFDHLKTTAAIANCIDLYLEEKFPNEYRQDSILLDQINDLNDKKFLLVGGDISGVQDFIYTISSAGALKSLRGRSFYLELLTEHIVDKILTDLNLCRANLIYSGGGGFYILAHNTNSSIGKIENIKIENIKNDINKWLLEEFEGRLYFNIEYQDFSGDEFNPPKISKVWENLSIKIEQSKKRKLNNILPKIFEIKEPNLKTSECAICHTDSVNKLYTLEDKGIDVCLNCFSLFYLGENLNKNDYSYILVYNDKPNHFDDKKFVLINGTYYELCNSLKDKDNKDKNYNKIYLINEWDLSKYKYNKTQVIPILCGRYKGDKDEFEDIANESTGAKLLGVLRMDVDNLGKIFVEGLKENERSFSRMSAISRNLTMFFKFYINSICEGNIENQLKISEDKRDKRKREVNIIYSGGDDLFIVGAWDETTELAFDINKAFTKFTCDNKGITLSAGLTLHKPGFPLYQMANISKRAEKIAKNNKVELEKVKNSLSLFYNDNMRLRNNNLNERIEKIENKYRRKDNGYDRIALALQWSEYENLIDITKEFNKIFKKIPHGFYRKLFISLKVWQEEGVFYIPILDYVVRKLEKEFAKDTSINLIQFRNIMDNLFINNHDKTKALHIPLTWVEYLNRKEARNE